MHYMTVQYMAWHDISVHDMTVCGSPAKGTTMIWYNVHDNNWLIWQHMYNWHSCAIHNMVWYQSITLHDSTNDMIRESITVHSIWQFIIWYDITWYCCVFGNFTTLYRCYFIVVSLNRVRRVLILKSEWLSGRITDWQTKDCWFKSHRK